jgi:hypothetical protein
MRALTKRTPWWLAAYLGGTVLLVVLSFLSSEITSEYSLSGAVLEIALLTGVYFGSAVCRWILIVLGVFISLSSLLLQSGTLEATATLWSILALIVTGFLLVPSVSVSEREPRHGHAASRG